MQSREYPDLPWVEANAWLGGRPYGPPLWIVTHTTEGSEGLLSAEAGADYDARRTDGTSTHFFHDQDSTIQSVLTTDRANAAKGTGNKFGIHHELCGVAAQSPAQWDDAASRGTITQHARQSARDAKRWKIPVRKLTPTQVAAMMPGFCEHRDISLAFGESDHTDPGRNYPWPSYLAQTLDFMNGADMPLTDADLDAVEARARKAVSDFVWGAFHASQTTAGETGDAAYLAADLATQKQWRNARDTLRGVLGGPVSEAKVLSAIAAVPAPTITLTADQIQAIAEILAGAAGGAITDIAARLHAAGVALAQTPPAV